MGLVLPIHFSVYSRERTFTGDKIAFSTYLTTVSLMLMSSKNGGRNVSQFQAA